MPKKKPKSEEENLVHNTLEVTKGILDAKLTTRAYEDAFQPILVEAGSVIKTALQLIHMPLIIAQTGINRVAEWLPGALAARLETVPEDRRIAPDPNVAIPAIAALPLVEHQPELREMYANLLATSMDRETAGKAHPAFVDMIRQLQPDEARMIGLFRTNKDFPTVSVSICMALSEGTSGMAIDRVIIRRFNLIAEQAGCQYPDRSLIYVDNLVRLRLIVIEDDERCEPRERYQEIYEHLVIRQSMQATEGAILPAKTQRGSITVTDFGRMFAEACT